ncbi:MAG: aminodeoxychorismate synthase component I [Vicinamibacteria bacterium]
MLVSEIPQAPSPAEACARFLDLPYPLLLESVVPSEPLGRYSYLTADPWRVLRTKGAAEDPLVLVEGALARHRVEPRADLPPFQGGVAGYFSYDLCHHLERLPSPRFDDLDLPDLCLGLYDWTLAWDHADGRTWLVSTGLPEDGPARLARAEERADTVRRRLGGRPIELSSPDRAPSVRRASGPTTHEVGGWPGVVSTFSREEYLRAVEHVREYIRAGDLFQANLSQRFETRMDDHPFALYSRLRDRNPAPFAGYFDFGDGSVASASPELFLRLTGDRVETRPIKGTSPRGWTPRHDSALGVALAESEKDRAENVMIVDLLRNDLSRVCRDHTVDVPELCRIERYATVHHLVSTVLGRLRPGLGAVDLLRATWPGGSITGAPKVRAMEIIAELEPTRRGVYTGSLGYISFGGAMETNIAIRTFVVKDGRAWFQAGGGIVADSDPEREYAETLDKARGMVAAVVHDPAHR